MDNDARVRSGAAVKKFVPGAVAVIMLASAGTAAADDNLVTKALAIPYAGPAYNWSGFYAGGHLGAAWGNSSWNAGSGIGGSTNLFQKLDTFDEGGSRGRRILSGLADAANRRESFRRLHRRQFNIYVA